MADSLTGISFRYAGFWLRMVAGAFDAGIVLFAMWLVAWVFNVDYAALEPTEAELNSIAMIEAGSVFAGWIYFASMESTAPQATVGKLFLGIYVTDLAGERLSFGHASLRYWAKVISTVILFVGFFMAAFTRHKQALHDIVASSLVLKR